MTREDMEKLIVETLAAMNVHVQEKRNYFRSFGMGDFGRGYELHDYGKKHAPRWLQMWDDHHRWVIVFAKPDWRWLTTMAMRFGFSKDDLLDSLISFKECCGD